MDGDAKELNKTLSFEAVDVKERAGYNPFIDKGVEEQNPNCN